MNMKKMLSTTLAILMVISSIPNMAFAESIQRQKIVIDTFEAAGLSGFRNMWDTPVKLDENGKTEYATQGVYGGADNAIWNSAKRTNGENGALAFDAVHRSLLVRFPGVASKIASTLQNGYEIEKIELVLPYKATEMWADGYQLPAQISSIRNSWKDTDPTWHADVSVLRKSWKYDATTGPTYNGNKNGSDYWTKFGAKDTTNDRYPEVFTQEISKRSPDGKIDVTKLLNDSTYGSTLEQRISNFDFNGFVVQKQEVYDAATYPGGYEWSTGTGGRGILINNPKLEITVKRASATVVNKAALQPVAPTGGTKTAVVPNQDEYNAFLAQYGYQKPAYVGDLAENQYKWTRIQELRALGGKATPVKFPETYSAYLTWIDEFLARVPRSYNGHDGPERSQIYFSYKDTFPDVVIDHWKIHWNAWLRPDKSASGLVNGFANGQACIDYYKATGDWRGNMSLYRTYSTGMGTMNFNYNALVNEMLGSDILNNQALKNEYTQGNENLLSRLWNWFDGTTQESLDHYYYGISLGAQKVIADFAPNRFDRILARATLTKSIEELATTYHPLIKRFAMTSGRSTPAYLIGAQDGVQAIIHSLSKNNAYTDYTAGTLDQRITSSNINTIPVLGTDLPPSITTSQTINAPWAEDWMTDIVDKTTYPVEAISNYKVWGSYTYATQIHKTSYLSKYYSIASDDRGDGGRTSPALIQWVRTNAAATSLTDIGTLTTRGGINNTNLIETSGGIIGNVGMDQGNVQTGSTLISMNSPRTNLSVPTDSFGRALPATISSIQSTVGLFNFQDSPIWKIYVNGVEKTTFPVSANYDDKITIHDGVTYMGIMPIANTLLSNDKQVVISKPTEYKTLEGKNSTVREALKIDAYIYSGTAVANATLKTDNCDDSSSGFVIEMGDSTQYADFNTFSTAFNAKSVTKSYNSTTKELTVSYTNMANKAINFNWMTRQTYPAAFSSRTVDGQSFLLADKMDRVSSYSQIGTTGVLNKGGFTLSTQAGRMAYLIKPNNNEVIAMNPLPDPTIFNLKEDAGTVEIKSDGKLSLAIVEVDKAANKVTVQYQKKATQTAPDMATCLLVKGLTSPTVIYNDQVVTTTTKSGWTLIQLDNAIEIPANLDTEVNLFTKITTATSYVAKDTNDMSVGNTRTPTKQVLFADGTSAWSLASITYYSLNPAVATYSNGVITGVGVGTTKVWFTATYGGITLKSNEETINVNPTTVHPRNISQNKKAIMTDEPGWGGVASKALDGSFSTKAQGLSGEPWDLIINLGGVYNVDGFRLTQVYNAYAKTYRLLTSMDNINWTEVASNYNGDGALVEHNFTSVQARFFKFDVITSQNGVGWGSCIVEAEVLGSLVALEPQFSTVNINLSHTTLKNGEKSVMAVDAKLSDGTPINLDNAQLKLISADMSAFVLEKYEGFYIVKATRASPTIQNVSLQITYNNIVVTSNAIPVTIIRIYPSGPKNLAMDKPATLNTAVYWPAGGAFDGNIDSFAQVVKSGGGDQPYILQVDLGEAKTVNLIKVKKSSTDSVYTIDYSLNGTTWTTIHSGSNQTEFEVNFADVSARYLRLNATKSVSLYGEQIFEFEAYGTEVVTERTISSVEISKPPTKTYYNLNQTLDLSGSEVVKTYTNGDVDRVPIQASDCSIVNTSTVGDKKVLVSIEGIINVFYIRVDAPANASLLHSISVVQNPVKSNYRVDEYFSATGMIVKAFYNDGSSQVITNYTMDKTAPLTVNDTNVKISYGGKDIYYAISVNSSVTLYAIQEQIDRALALEGPSSYTKVSYNAMATILAQAQAMVQDSTVTQTEYELKAAELKTAIDNLVYFKAATYSIVDNTLVISPNHSSLKYSLNLMPYQTSNEYPRVQAKARYILKIMADNDPTDVRTLDFIVPNIYKIIVETPVNGTVSGNNYSFYNLNDTINLTATPNSGYRFSHWENQKRVLSDNANFSLTAGQSQTIFARFIADTKYKVVFKDITGAILKVEAVSSGGTATAPNAPYKKGYIVDKWTVDGTNEVSLSNVTSDLSVYPIYKQDVIAKYYVTVVNASGSGEYNFDYKLTLTPDQAPQGYEFSHWEINGAAAGYSSTFNIRVTGDLTITATYKLIGTQLQNSPKIEINNIYGEETYKFINCQLLFPLMGGERVVETGVLISYNNNFSLQNQINTSKSIATSTTAEGQFMMIAQLTKVDKNLYVRAFLTYENEGVQTTVYTDVYILSYTTDFYSDTLVETEVTATNPTW
jgi:hypothetical protein